MKLLAIESTGAKASVAIINRDGDAVTLGSDETMNHLQHLIPMIQQLLTNCASTIGDIAGILVSEGPGSFTGIRIGMATARALAQSLDVPVVGVPTLRSFAYHAPQPGEIVCPVFDARRDQVYAGAYRWEAVDGVNVSVTGGQPQDLQLRQLVKDDAYALMDFLGLVAPQAQGMTVVFYGDGVDRYGEQIQRWAGQMATQGGFSVTVAPEERRYQAASSIARLGREMFLGGQQKRFDEVLPVYLRQAEAQRKLDEKMAQLANHE